MESLRISQPTYSTLLVNKQNLLRTMGRFNNNEVRLGGMVQHKYTFGSYVRVEYLSSSSMFSLCGYFYRQFLLLSVDCCSQDYPIIPTIPARPLPDPLHCSHPTGRRLLLVCNHLGLFEPQRCLCLDGTL